MTAQPLFYAVEIDAYAPPSTTTSNAQGHGKLPHGLFAGALPVLTGTETLRASDLGYRTAPTDAGGPLPYPPLLSGGFSVDRAMNLVPGQSAAAAAWGTLSLVNRAGSLNSYAVSRNCDGRGARIYGGRKSLDPSRGYLTDPPYAALSRIFAGVAQTWRVSDTTLDIPLRDATYWIERPLQAALYGGTGGLDGGADLLGKPKPKARGGTSALPIVNVPAVLVDAVNLIYQYSDGPGTVVNVFEGGFATFTPGADVANLYSGATAAGAYRTCNALGLFQLGSSPVHAITADVTGQFPVAGARTTALSIARYLLTEDLALPSASIDLASFSAVDAAYPYVSGAWFGSDTVWQGVDAVAFVLGGLAVQLIPKRSGALAALPLRAPGAMPTAAFTPANATAMAPKAMPSALTSPAFRWRVGYQRAWSVQTTDLSPSITPARTTLIGVQDRYAGFVSSAIQSGWLRPADPDPVAGALLSATDAQSVANALGALFCAPRRLLDVTLPIDTAMACELGDTVQLAWPAADLASGRAGTVVGESLRGQAGTSTLTVLV